MQFNLWHIIFALYVTFKTLFSQYVNTLDVFDGFFLKLTIHWLQRAVIMICMSYAWYKQVIPCDINFNVYVRMSVN